MTETLKKFISSNEAYITIIGLFIGLFGILLAFIFYFKSIRRKKANFFIQSFNLLNVNLTGMNKLLINYNGDNLKQLTATKIAIWNSGDVTLDKNDFIELDPLRITTLNSEIKIYDIGITKFSDTSNNFSLVKSDSNIYHVVFDYLDKSQGALIKILHSGLSSNDIVLDGKLKGIGKIELKENSNYLPHNRDPKFAIEYFWFIDRIGWLIFMFGTFAFLYLSATTSGWYFLASVFCAYSTFRLYPKKVVPKELKDIFFEG